MLKESEFNIYKKSDEQYFVFNTLYGGYAKLELSEYKGLKMQPPYIEEEATKKLLIQNGFLVDADIDEREILEEVYVKYHEVRNRTKTYTVAVTTECNANCFYCYERGTKIVRMSREIADAIIEDMVRSYDGKEAITITWFGGEPLMNIPIISYISEQLTQKEVLFETSMISNGFLLDETVIEMAKKKWNLRQVQISLDGFQDSYNKTKKYVGSEKNPFQRVMRNIKSLVDRSVYVSVRLNIHKKNVSDIISVVRYLSEKIPFSQYLEIYPAFVTGLQKDDLLNDKEKVKIIKKLFGEFPFYAYLLGRSKIYEPPRIYACMRDMTDALVVDADGSVCRCEHEVGQNKPYNIREIDKWNKMKLDYQCTEHCCSCVYYPRCLGGCMAARLEGGEYCNVDRYIIEAIMEEDASV